MREKLRAALREIAGLEVAFEIRRLNSSEFGARGEYSSNIAFALAAKIRSTPFVVADEIAAKWKEKFKVPANQFEDLSGITCIATKGFLNFRMNDDTLHHTLDRALAEGERYGAGTSLAGKRVNVEFVSADPTGPLQLAHGRIAVAGDALCRMLAFAGADVTREYFLNDVEDSSKMRLLGESVAAQYNRRFGHDEEMPEGALDDEFVREVAAKIAEREGNGFLLRPDAERIAAFAHEARDAAVENQKQTLRALNVHFDVWSSESTLAGDGRVASMLARLQEAGHIYETGGAFWLRTTALGDEADRPLRRANGEYTYLASDIAYHAYRFERGFDLLINIWTSQHEQYLQRTRAALQAAKYPADNLEVLVCESTYIAHDDAAHDSEPLLNDALDEVEAETLRFLWLLAEWKEVAKIETDSARRDDDSNPAYAARLLPSRLRTLIGQSEAGAPAGETPIQQAEMSEPERQLARLVALWPDEIAAATSERRPQRVARFVLEMAEATRQLLGASRPGQSTPAPLLRAAHVTAGNALRVLGLTPRDNF